MRKLIYLIMLLISIGIVSAASQWVNNPVDCVSSDQTNFPGQNCAPQDICGDSSSIAQCYDTSLLNPPGSTATSTTSYSGSYGGGYIINCYATADGAAPYCDNSGAAWCNRDSSCYNVNRITSCNASIWVGYNCTTCVSGYTYCDGDWQDGDGCEVQSGVTNCATGANNNINSGCTCVCDSGYLDCDGLGTDVGNGCEIQDGGTCSVAGISGTYNGCSGGLGNCVITKQHFITSTDALYQTNSTGHFLWGMDFGSGYLVNLSNNVTKASFRVDQYGGVSIGTANYTGAFFVGNGSTLSSVCLSNGSFCQATGFTNGTDINVKNLILNQTLNLGWKNLTDYPAFNCNDHQTIYSFDDGGLTCINIAITESQIENYASNDSSDMILAIQPNWYYNATRINTTVLVNQSGKLGIVTSWFNSFYLTIVDFATHNTTMKTYVNQQNTTMGTFVLNRILLNNQTVNAFWTTNNATIKTYIDDKNNSMKTYVDFQDTVKDLHKHNATNITSGTFPGSQYTFAGIINITTGISAGYGTTPASGEIWSKDSTGLGKFGASLNNYLATYDTGSNGVNLIVNNNLAYIFGANDFVPGSALYDLGNSTKRWDEVHADNGWFYTDLRVGTALSGHTAIIENADSESVLRIVGPGDSYGEGSKINFGDGQYVYFGETNDDKLELRGSGGIVLNYSTNGVRIPGIAAASATDYVCIDTTGLLSSGATCTKFENVVLSSEILTDSEFKVKKIKEKDYPLDFPLSELRGKTKEFIYTIAFNLQGKAIEGEIKVPGNMEAEQIPYYLKTKINIERGTHSLIEKETVINKIYNMNEPYVPLNKPTTKVAKIPTENYLQCRIGNTYGTWVLQSGETYKCDVTNEESICWKTTKTRCYLYS